MDFLYLRLVYKLSFLSYRYDGGEIYVALYDPDTVNSAIPKYVLSEVNFWNIMNFAPF